jgi:hypothetical protein
MITGTADHLYPAQAHPATAQPSDADLPTDLSHAQNPVLCS